MKFFVVAVALVAFFAVIALAAEDRTLIEYEESIPIPVGWRRVSSTPLAQSRRRINLVFALKRNNLDRLEEIFWDVSNPKSEQYGHHLSLKQLTDLIAPSERVQNLIISWLEGAGVSDIRTTLSRDFIAVTVSVPLAARLLDIEFHTYRHVSGVSVDTSVGPYSLPSSIAEHIDLVSGAIGFPDVTVPMLQVNPTPSPDALEITPDVIRTRYNITAIGTNSQNMHAVAEFQAQFYSPTDLKNFWNDFVSYAPFQPVSKVIGTNVPLSPGIEASLDIEYIMAVAPNVTTYFYSMKNFNFWQDLLTWVGELGNETNPPYIHSVSYGSQGDYPSDAYRRRLNTDFMNLGTRGLTIVFASGDSGAGCEGRGFGSDVVEAACDCTFYPSFPATCPYVLTVGATRFLSGNSGSEGAVQAFGSGGGFSQYFPVPSYQSSAVSAYLQSGVNMPEACAFNSTNRATPDVSALGDVHFQVVNGGRTISVGGTSASAPTFSGVLTLLNDIRLNKGSNVLGFVNPWIYQTASQNPSAFFDVTQGNNVAPGCCRSGKLGGFDCSMGWDPVSGVGTPNYAVLSTLV